MIRARSVLLGGLLLGCILACQTTQPKTEVQGGMRLPAGAKIRVQEVVNDTRQVQDVDVIGLFWDALNLALKDRSLLWTGEPGVQPLQLQVHVLKYKKGSAVQRWAMPGFGTTLLDARIDVLDGDRHLGSIEVQRSVSLGDGFTTRGGWRTVFTLAAQDAVSALMSKFGA